MIDKVYFDGIKREIQALPDSYNGAIKASAARLNALNYKPLLLKDVDNFIFLKKADMLSIIEQWSAEDPLPSEEAFNLLVYHFKLLTRLRRDEPEAWDEVAELMEDD